MSKAKKGGKFLEEKPRAQQPLKELQNIVRKHEVCWEALPEQVPVEGDRPVPVGFDLMLYGTHAHGDRPMPGCDKCVLIYRDLRKIARWIIPKMERVSRYEISMYESATGYSPVRGNRPDVTLTIRILHRSAYDRPVDECEVLCLNEMKGKLLELGAQEKRWIG